MSIPTVERYFGDELKLHLLKFFLGNVEVWHGNLDILINNDLAVKPIDEKPDSPGDKSATEVKLRNGLQRNPQIIAQTIVFSFLQKKRHPERSNFLTPCIGIGSTELIVMLYDSEHDVLLESSSVPLFEQDLSLKFSFQAILVCWLTVNYKFFCCGLDERYRKHKSNFFVHAKEKIQIYEDKLTLGNVCNTTQLNDRNILLPPSKLLRSKKVHDNTATLLNCLKKVSQSEYPDSNDIGSTSSSK